MRSSYACAQSAGLCCAVREPPAARHHGPANGESVGGTTERRTGREHPGAESAAAALSSLSPQPERQLRQVRQARSPCARPTVCTGRSRPRWAARTPCRSPEQTSASRAGDAAAPMLRRASRGAMARASLRSFQGQRFGHASSCCKRDHSRPSHRWATEQPNTRPVVAAQGGMRTDRLFGGCSSLTRTPAVPASSAFFLHCRGCRQLLPQRCSGVRPLTDETGEESFAAGIGEGIPAALPATPRAAPFARAGDIGDSPPEAAGQNATE